MHLQVRGSHPDDAIALEDQVGHLSIPDQREFRVGTGFFGEEVEEIPLRHQRDVGLLETESRECAEVPERS